MDLPGHGAEVTPTLDEQVPQPLDDVLERGLHRHGGTQWNEVGHAREGTGRGHHSMRGVGATLPVGGTAYFCRT